MKRRHILNWLGAAAMALVLPATGAKAQEVTLTLHQFLPAQANVPKLVLDVWADNVEEASGGRIKVDRYPSMQLGGRPPELMDQAIEGIADVVWTVVGYTPGRYPSTEVFELPFMMTNARAVSHAYWEMFEKHMKDDEFKDVHILGTWVHGPGMIHVNKEVRCRARRHGGPENPRRLALVNGLLEKLGAPTDRHAGARRFRKGCRKV
jgi:C4-dicarboxylate-binding protein DctP